MRRLSIGVFGGLGRFGLRFVSSTGSIMSARATAMIQRAPRVLQPETPQDLQALLVACVHSPHRQFAAAVQHLGYSMHFRIAFELIRARKLINLTCPTDDINALLKIMWEITPRRIGILMTKQIEGIDRILFIRKENSSTMPHSVAPELEVSEAMLPEIAKIAQSIAADVENREWVPSLVGNACVAGAFALARDDDDTRNLEAACNLPPMELMQNIVSFVSGLDDIKKLRLELSANDSWYPSTWAGLGTRQSSRISCGKKEILQTCTSAAEQNAQSFAKLYTRMQSLFKAAHSIELCNARTFAILFAAALRANRADDAKAFFNQLKYVITCPALDGTRDAKLKNLLFVLQPGTLRHARELEVITPSQYEQIVNPSPGSLHWEFLHAVQHAMRGDQKGSKHGATITIKSHDHNVSHLSHDTIASAGVVSVLGHNHVSYVSYEESTLAKRRARNSAADSVCSRTNFETVKASTKIALDEPNSKKRSRDVDQPHQKLQRYVMHSEMHAACTAIVLGQDIGVPVDEKFPLLNSRCWVVELDGIGVGYEEAVPCPMCNMGLIRSGVTDVYYTAHIGIESVHLQPNLDMGCVALEQGVPAVLRERAHRMSVAKS